MCIEWPWLVVTPTAGSDVYTQPVPHRHLLRPVPPAGLRQMALLGYYGSIFLSGFTACKFGASVACDRHTANGRLRAVPRAGSFGRFIAWQANADIGWHPTPQAQSVTAPLTTTTQGVRSTSSGSRKGCGAGAGLDPGLAVRSCGSAGRGGREEGADRDGPDQESSESAHTES